MTFQSRNRGSFDFKSMLSVVASVAAARCFNLVIEVLLISSFQDQSHQRCNSQFQSRNRGSFDFKCIIRVCRVSRILRFNLVIEVLLISSQNYCSWGVDVDEVSIS